MQLYSDGGQTVFTSLTDTGTVQKSAILVLNHSDGNVGIGTTNPNNTLTLVDGGVAGSQTYVSGFAGNGWVIDDSSGTSATFDNLTVRGTMSIYELLIHQVRATNGSLWISSTGKVVTPLQNGATAN